MLAAPLLIIGKSGKQLECPSLIMDKKCVGINVMGVKMNKTEICESVWLTHRNISKKQKTVCQILTFFINDRKKQNKMVYALRYIGT